MPFGLIFGAIFFLFCAGLGLRFAGSVEASARVGGLLMATLGLALALGLLTRRSWARWAGVLAALGMILFGAFRVDAGGTTLDFAIVMAGLVTATLLLLRATSEIPGRSTDAATTRGGLGRVLGWTTALSGLGLIAVAGSNFVGQPARPEPQQIDLAGFSRRIQWSDFGDGVQRARAEGKQLLVTFETQWCGYCKKMDQTTWKHPSVVERLAEVVPVKVDSEDGRSLNGFTGVQLAGQYQVSGTPTTMLLDAEGRVLSRAGGYQTPRQFLSWLDEGLGSAGANRLRVSGP